MSHNFFIVLSVTLIILGIACQLAIGFLIQNMIQETDNMTATDHKLLKACKLKFMNCYRLNGGVNNVQIFAEKFVNRLKLGKVSLVTLGHLSGQMVMLAVFAAGTGIYFGITGGDSVLELLPFYIVSFLGLYLFFSVSSAVDIPGKKKILKTNLVDYFENHMISRLGTVPDSLRELEEKERGDWEYEESCKEDTGWKEEIRAACSSRVAPYHSLDSFKEDGGLFAGRNRPGSPGSLDSFKEDAALGGGRKSSVSSGSRESAKNRARGKECLPEERPQPSESWQDVLRDNLSEEELQALLSEFLA